MRLRDVCRSLKIFGSVFVALGLMMGTSALTVGAADPVPNGTVLADCIPSVSDNGRAMMFDGTSLYYTLSGSSTIFKIAPPTDGTVSSPSACPVVSSCVSSVTSIGALSFDRDDGNAWAGAYDGSGRIWKLNPATCATVVPPMVVPCPGDIFSGFIDGLAVDPTDDTLWYGCDESTHIHHITTSGTVIGSCDTPPPPMMSAGNGLKAGIAADMRHLFLSLYTSLDGTPRSIATVDKADSGVCTKDSEFLTSTALPANGTEGLALDKDTIWSDSFGFVNHITRWSN